METKKMTNEEIQQEMNFIIAKKDELTANDYIRLTELHNRQVDLMEKEIILKIKQG